MSNTTHNENMRREATIFRLWREGTSVDWDCTADELAEALKLSPSYVQKIAKERGWPIQIKHNMRSTHGRFRGHYIDESSRAPGRRVKRLDEIIAA